MSTEWETEDISTSQNCREDLTYTGNEIYIHTDVVIRLA